MIKGAIQQTETQRKHKPIASKYPSLTGLYHDRDQAIGEERRAGERRGREKEEEAQTNPSEYPNRR